ncbi:MAG TPA: hypothetical protein PLX03_10805 [Candidatus Hydrogenedentes bacterium]|nr:hypothetical protein [Candidatus Hydrogenedentota bacterium]
MMFWSDTSKSRPAWILALCVLGLPTLSPAQPPDPEKGFAFTDKVVLAYYYI